MARQLRVEFPHAVYHVTSRGNGRRPIARDDRDRAQFLETLGHVVSRFGWQCHAYCLMPNHYHLLIETPQPNLSRGMRQLNGLVTQAFNRRHKRPGHLFQGRYKAILVERDAYLLALCRYVVLNPVAAKLAKTPQAWRWSSYQATAGLCPTPEWLTTDWVLSQFAKTRDIAQRRYRDFVGQGLASPSPWDDLKGQIYLGSEKFIAAHQPNCPLREIPRRQTQHVRPTLSELFTKRRDRDDALALAYRTYGYRLNEIAAHLGVHYSTVSRYLKQAESEMRDRKA